MEYPEHWEERMTMWETTLGVIDDFKENEQINDKKFKMKSIVNIEEQLPPELSIS